MPEKDKSHSLKITLETSSYMLKIVAKEKPLYIVMYVIKLISNFIFEMSNVIIPKFIIDELMEIIGILNSGTPSDGINDHIQLAVLWVVTVVGIQFVRNILTNVFDLTEGIYTTWFRQYTQKMMLKKTMEMDFQHTEDPDALDAANKAREGIGWYGGVTSVLQKLYSIVINVSVALGVVVVVVTTAPLMLPLQALALVFIIFIQSKINKIEYNQYLKMSKLDRMFNYYLFEMTTDHCGKEIRMYDSADMMTKKSVAFVNSNTAILKDTLKKSLRLKKYVNIINALRDSLNYFYIGYLALKGMITVGDFSMCVSAASSLYWALHGLSTGILSINQTCAYAHRYIEFMNYPDAISKGSKKVSEGNHTIEFRHVGFKYPRSEEYVLKDVNITINAGEHLSVVGLNGAGKTTFIKLLCRLYDVTEGQILVDGTDIREYSDDEYRKLFAPVFQDFKIFAFSLRENITAGEKTDDERINEMLKLAGFYDDSVKLEKGLDTPIKKGYDEGGIELSGGQMQKTAISRALYRNAPVVILDEPTAALDPIAEYDIYRKFDVLVGGKTAIYISHRLSSCKFCDKIAVFSEKSIKEYGTHDELVKLDGGVYAEMFAAQAEYYVNAN